MIEWIHMPEAEQKQILTQVALAAKLPEQAIEKDIWVTLLLQALFSLPGISEHLLFKGGTSLSKAYGLIDRFSEDIDFALDRKLLGFDGPLSRTAIDKKLRPASADFIRSQLIPQLTARLQEIGVPDDKYRIATKPDVVDDADPLPVYVYYHSVLHPSTYLGDKVEIEIGARSLMEPAEARKVQSLIAGVYPQAPFAGQSFAVTTVWPGRTFLEKVFLLHEQFLLPPDKALPKNRMSRHLYDVEKLMDTHYAQEAMGDTELYRHIVEHRQHFTPVRGIAYDQHGPATVNFLPPAAVVQNWRADYNALAENMIGGTVLSFDVLIGRLMTLQERFRTAIGLEET